MKKIIVGMTFVLVSMSTLVQADELTYCEAQRELAKQTMSFRQSGGSRAEFDAVVYSEEGQAIADMAWARGVIPQSVRKTAVNGFADHVERQCLQSSEK
jgi:beta-lactamase class A